MKAISSRCCLAAHAFAQTHNRPGTHGARPELLMSAPPDLPPAGQASYICAVCGSSKVVICIKALKASWGKESMEETGAAV